MVFLAAVKRESSLLTSSAAWAESEALAISAKAQSTFFMGCFLLFVVRTTA
jgi:hypothetical protein